MPWNESSDFCPHCQVAINDFLKKEREEANPECTVLKEGIYGEKAGRGGSHHDLKEFVLFTAKKLRFMFYLEGIFKTSSPQYSISSNLERIALRR